MIKMNLLSIIVLLFPFYTKTHDNSGGPNNLEKEFCFNSDSGCQRSEEYCSITTKRCEKLFSEEDSDVDKFSFCKEEAKNPHSPKHHACIYFIGKYILCVLGQVPTCKDFKKNFEKSPGDTEICFNNIVSCKQGEQYSLPKLQVCVPKFKDDATEEEQLPSCYKISESQEKVPGIFDNLIPYNGKLTFQQDTKTQDNSGGPNLLEKEFCPNSDSGCQRSEEYCSITTKRCEKLFSEEDSDEEKFSFCKEEAKYPHSPKHHACIYFIGKYILCVLEQVPTCKDFKKNFEKSPGDTEICFNNIVSCKQGEQYSFSNLKVCVPKFKDDATKKEQLAFCYKISESQEKVPGIFDNLIPYKGKLTLQKDTKTQDNSGRPNLLEKECSPNSDSGCQRGEEYCSITTKRCEKLFSEGDSDEEKFSFCKEEAKYPHSPKHRACNYFIEKHKTDYVSQKSFDERLSKLEKNLDLGLGLGLGFGVPAAIVIIVLIVRRLKKKCLPAANITEPGNPTRGNEDIASQEMVALNYQDEEDVTQ